MSHQWFVVGNGKEAGPFTAQELKSLAYEGLKVDLVRRDDMKTAVQAHSIKGLFPEPQQAPAIPPPIPAAGGPPPLPATSIPPPLPPVDEFTAPNYPQPPFVPQGTTTDAPALWNPTATRVWGFFCTWAFGSILTAKNWRAIGEFDKARRSMVWFYAFFPYLLLCAITPNSMAQLFRYVSLAIFCAWVYFESEPQRKYVKERFGKNYLRKSWLVPSVIGIPIFCFLMLGVFAGFADLQSSDSTVALVRTGYLKSYPGTPIGIAFDHFLGSPRWDSGKSSTGQVIVNVEGNMTYANKPVHATVQFHVNPNAGQFEVGAFELNGVPQNQLLKMALVAKVFEEYRK